tara:strand:+ start:141 stop:386 length:246 start_codon:yes stop_codon:yes gene_type:complete
MKSKTQIVGNQNVTVRFLNDDGVCVDGFRNIEERYFDFVFRRLKGDLEFGIKVSEFGGTNCERYNFTTLTDKQLQDRNIIN